jgi:hypothetical protein
MTNKCELCSKFATFGFESGNPLRCKMHKEKNMKDVKSNMCTTKNCDTRATFGFSGEKASKCKKHAEKNMRDVTNKRCELCDKIPNFAFPDEKKARRCKTHKEDEMIDKKHKTCEKCDKRASFGIKKPTRCKKHIEKGMKIIGGRKCTFKNCVTTPVFGFSEDNKAIRCKKHKIKNMIDIRNKRCVFDGCDKSCTFGYGKKLLRCNEHKLGDMKDVRHKMCQSCQLFRVDRKKLCNYCDPSLRRKTKEYEVKEFLDSNECKFQHNKSSGFVCGNYRPDFLFDAGTHFVVVECDEEQHKWYDSSCELARMNNIYIANGLPTIFLRYNPDTYKRRETAVRFYKKRRLATLLEQIEYHTQHIPSSPLSFVYLYYDCECEECDGIHDNTEDMIENFKDLILS